MTWLSIQLGYQSLNTNIKYKKTEDIFIFEKSL
jgi:hypothetical protein